MRTMEAAQVTDILNDVAEQMINLMSELVDEKGSFEKLGIGYEEKAFYDILIAVEENYEFEYSEEANIRLAKKIHEKVTDISKYPNWAIRNDTKAKLQSDIMMLLWEDGFPPLPDQAHPEDYFKVYNDILEQSENFKRYFE